MLKLIAANVLRGGVGKRNVALGVPGTLDVNGFAETVNRLNDSGTVENTGAGATILTVGANDASGAFSGTIHETGGTLTVIKIGVGTQTFSGVQDYDTLNANGGTTDVNSDLGTGLSTLNVSATANLRTRQRFATLNIVDGGVVVLGVSPGLAPSAALEGDLPVLIGGAAPSAVPEPGTFGLLLLGAGAEGPALPDGEPSNRPCAIRVQSVRMGWALLTDAFGVSRSSWGIIP